MHTKKTMRRVLLATLTGPMMLMLAAPEGLADETLGGLLEGDSLTGGVYMFSRNRVRKDAPNGQYRTNLQHTTLNTALDYSSGYLGGVVGFDLGGFFAHDLANGNRGAGHEFSFHGSNRWSTPYSEEGTGASLHRARLKMKIGDESANFGAKIGWTQLNAGVLGVNWSFMPGTYQGAQFDAGFGPLKLAYGIANEYKAPWYKELAEFRRPDGTKIDFIHSLGGSYTFGDGTMVELGVGQADDYMTGYLAQVSRGFAITDTTKLKLNYQFYGQNDTHDDKSKNDVYNDFAWNQALSATITSGPWKVNSELQWVHAPGPQGYFLPRLTQQYGSSNGRYDIWWDGRSDFNHDGEKSAVLGVSYDWSNLGFKGWSTGASYAYGWDLKGWGGRRDKPVKEGARESALNFDVGYVIPDGRMQGTSFKLHYTIYDNHSNEPSWGAYGNLFQDEKDVKFLVSVPFTLF